MAVVSVLGSGAGPLDDEAHVVAVVAHKGNLVDGMVHNNHLAHAHAQALGADLRRQRELRLSGKRHEVTR